MKKNTKWFKGWSCLWLLVLLLCAGCGSGKTPDATPTPTVTPTATVSPTPTPEPDWSVLFEEFSNELFVNEITANTINLHYTLAYPENFGITEYEPSLGSMKLDEMKESYNYMRELKKELESFNYEKLTDEQQMTYDIILDYLETELMTEDLILYNEIMGPITGYQAQLPVLLAEYKFRTVQDVEDYLALLALVDDVFADIVEFEKAKSEAGLFMSDMVANSIIDQCRQFIEKPEENYMIDVFLTEIEMVEGLSEEEKQAYIEKNNELVTTEIVNAYQILMDGMEGLLGTGTNELGLSHYEHGAKYYEYLVKSSTGSSRSVEELMEMTYNHITACWNELLQIARKNPNIGVVLTSYRFCETEPDKIMQDLMEKVKEDFPEPPEVNYKIKYVHPSMEDHMSPAFYLTPPVDDLVNNVIYINGKHASDYLYTTVAHEGYPGHLYQNVYTGSKNLPLVRNLFSNTGYSEGWATYVEIYSYKISGVNPTLARFLQLDNAMSLGLSAYIDMGVHYLGWSAENIESVLAKFNLSGNGMANTLLETIVKEPGAYLPYFVGYLEILNLKDVAEEAWGEEYTLKRFHEAVLSLGSAPFDVLEKEIREYNWE